MKLNRKSLLLILCAVMLVAASVFGTIAYFTDSASVTNTLTVGKVAITLDEAAVDVNGEATDGDRVAANSYHLIPGHDYDKDPTIHVEAGSSDCWLFVKVENGIADVEGTPTIASQMAAKGWTLVASETDVYAYRTAVAEGTDVVVFETFAIADGITNAQLAAVEDASINVIAYAVQASGFDTAAAAWTAAPAEWPQAQG